MKTPLLSTTEQCWNEPYDDDKDFTLASHQEITEFLHYTSSQAPKSALDIGSGTGQLTRELYHRGYKVIGIDWSTCLSLLTGLSLVNLFTHSSKIS